MYHDHLFSPFNTAPFFQRASTGETFVDTTLKRKLDRVIDQYSINFKTTQNLNHSLSYDPSRKLHPQDSTPCDSFLTYVAECLVLRDCSSPNELIFCIPYHTNSGCGYNWLTASSLIFASMHTSNHRCFPCFSFWCVLLSIIVFVHPRPWHSD
jgi:hypothetical protein